VLSVVPLDDMSGEVAALPGRRQAFRIVRTRTCLTTGETPPPETACGLTSLAPLRAGPSELLALDRGHREIENRLHCVRDVSCDEDRSTVHVGAMPRNLACLSNAAISIVRMRGEFRCLAPARRHQSAGQDRALREILGPSLRAAPRRASGPAAARAGSGARPNCVPSPENASRNDPKPVFRAVAVF